MAEARFKNRYRTTTTRLPQYDYGKAGFYFVTICTHDRLSFFGDVVNENPDLSAIGHIAHDCWLAIPQHHTHVALDAFVIMPNHVHGLIQIVNPVPAADPVRQRVGNQFGPLQKGSLPAIVQSYKAAVTRQCRQQGHEHFKWQPRYYEHIVRQDGSLDRIRQYIVDNPRKWATNQQNLPNQWM
jgi:REP element-mobilizing transposase RayT